MISSYAYMFDKVINISIPMLKKKKTNNLNLEICLLYDVYALGASVYYNLLLLLIRYAGTYL